MKTPEETITIYVEACRMGDDRGLRQIFAKNAMMCGYFENEFYIGSPEIFFDEVRDEITSPIPDGEYSGEISSVEIFDKIACVTLKELNYLGSNFTNLFQLACLNGSWMIVSKTYMDG